MEIYDIDGQWDSVRLHLNDPIVQTALDVGMAVYTEDLPAIPGPWRCVRAPWMFSDEDQWDYLAHQRFEGTPDWHEWMRWSEKQEPQGTEAEVEAWYDSDAAQHVWDKYNELCADHYPQPDSPDWYRCYGAEHFLGAFNCALGMRVAPHLTWKVVSGRKHTTAIGYDEGKSLLCFDLLWHKTAAELLKELRPILWRNTLGEELTNMRHVLGKGHV